MSIANVLLNLLLSHQITEALLYFNILPKESIIMSAILLIPIAKRMLALFVQYLSIYSSSTNFCIGRSPILTTIY